MLQLRSSLRRDLALNERSLAGELAGRGLSRLVSHMHRPFNPGVLLRSPAQDLQLRRSQVVRLDLARIFSGRFGSMAQMCLP